MEQTTYTSNGIPVYSYVNPHLHTFCICLYVRGGSMYESPEENGSTHFFEHIVFKNINRLMDGKLYQTLDKLGLSFNASTCRELIQFTMTGAPKHFNEAAKIMSRIFSPLDLPENEINLERKRILAEIREHAENKDLEYFVQKKVWKGTRLAQSIAGKKKILKDVTCKDLRKMQKKLLSLNNCFFYLTGAVSEENISYLSDQMTRFRLKDLSLGHDNVAVLPKNFGHRKPQLHTKKGDYTELGFAFDYHSGIHSEAARSLLYDLLFSGDNCRIFQELSEKTGYIYSFDSHLEEYENAGKLYLSFEISPSMMKKAAKKVTEIIQDLKKGKGITLEYVLPAYVDNAGLQLDDAESLNWTMAYEKHFLGEPWNSLEERNEIYRKITPEDIQSLSQDIFRPENLTLCFKGEKEDVPKKLAELIFSALS